MGDVLNKLGISGILLLSQIVNFLLIMIILRLFLYGPVLAMLDKRKERVANSMKDAERASGAAAEAQKEKRRDHGCRSPGSPGSSGPGHAGCREDGRRCASRAEQESSDIRMKAQAEAKAQTEEVLAQAQSKSPTWQFLATEKIFGP